MSDYTVKIQSDSKYKVSVSLGAGAVSNLSDLLDVDVSDLQDSYVIMYDATTQKYKAVNPDLVLSKATTEPISPGLPAVFEDKLDVDLDDRIDLDAGGF